VIAREHVGAAGVDAVAPAVAGVGDEEAAVPDERADERASGRSAVALVAGPQPDPAAGGTEHVPHGVPQSRARVGVREHVVSVVADDLEGQLGGLLPRRQAADPVGDGQENRRLAPHQRPQRAHAVLVGLAAAAGRDDGRREAGREQFPARLVWQVGSGAHSGPSDPHALPSGICGGVGGAASDISRHGRGGAMWREDTDRGTPRSL
jgi:hypothetical protein